MDFTFKMYTSTNILLFWGKGMHQLTWLEAARRLQKCFNWICFGGEGKHAQLFLSCKNKFQLIWWPRYSTALRWRRSVIVICGVTGNIQDRVARLSALSLYVFSRLIEFVQADSVFWHFHWLHWSLQKSPGYESKVDQLLSHSICLFSYHAVCMLWSHYYWDRDVSIRSFQRHCN